MSTSRLVPLIAHRNPKMYGRKSPHRRPNYASFSMPGDDDEKNHGHSRRHFRLPSWPQHRTRRLRVVYLLLLAVTLYLFLRHTSSVTPAPASPSPSPSNAQRTAMGRSATPMAGAARHKQRLAASRTVGRKRAPIPEIKAESRHPVIDGRLQVNPKSVVHPVHQLMSDAREAWDAKLAGQSRTLAAAVAEYKRRYKRPPPRGFDKWWAYVKKHNVQLPDEYDQIDRDLHLFWALHPRDLQQRIYAASKLDDTFTIKLKHGVARTSGKFTHGQTALHRHRRDGQFALVRDVAQHIPDMDVVYSMHDTPWTLLSWGHRQSLLEFIENDEFMDTGDEMAGDMTYQGWKSACPPRSALHLREGEPLPALPKAVGDKSFVADARGEHDICRHPETVRLHGTLTGKTPVDEPLSALFSISKTALHGDVLGVPPERVAAVDSAVPWGEKNASRLLWRGTTTGMYYSSALEWRDTHRVRLMGLGAEEEGTKTILPAPGAMAGRTLLTASTTVNKSDANPHYFDMAFVGPPIQCEPSDGTCSDIEESYPFRQFVQPQEADRHKYIIDIDGNGWSARFQRLMASGSLVFKSTIMPEWWNDRIQPWVHYVPVKVDYSDLHDALAFFAGDVHGKGGADDLAQGVAEEGREWAAKFYRNEDMTAYVFRLYLEWARLQAPNRAAMAFDLTEEIIAELGE